MTHLFRQLAARINNLFTIGTFSKRYEDGKIQIETPYKRTLEGIEIFPYGFAAKAKNGTVLVLSQGGNFDSVAFFPVADTGDAPEVKDGDSALYASGGASVICRADGTVELYGDDYGGVVKVQELQNQLEKNNQILQTFLTVLKTPIPEPGNGAPSAFQAALAAALGSAQVGNFSEIASNKVKHGSG